MTPEIYAPDYLRSKKDPQLDLIADMIEKMIKERLMTPDELIADLRLKLVKSWKKSEGLQAQLDKRASQAILVDPTEYLKSWPNHDGIRRHAYNAGAKDILTQIQIEDKSDDN